ncbi:MAG: CNNM domain-containing protein [Limisphaerales bacterium]
MAWAVFIPLLLALLVVSFVLSGMEAGVLALNRLRIRNHMRKGGRRARLLHGWLEQPENFLWTILVGNSLANFLAGGMVVYVLHRSFKDAPALFAGATLAMALLFYAWCELLPKMLFTRFPNRLTLLVAPLFRGIHFALRPLVGVTTTLSNGLLRWTGGRVFTGHLFANRDELRRLMQESAQGMTSEERVMISRVLDLQNLTVRSVAVPWEKVVSVEVGTPMKQVMELFRQRQFTRMPVCESRTGRARVAGVLSLRRLLFQTDVDERKLAADYLQPALYLDEEMRLEDALRAMQRSGQRLGIVLARDRRELGVVSLEDILKAVFGEVSL